MFLTESVKYGAPAVDANPSTGWRMLYESEVAWGKLTMGMTRLEHDAIVNEDSKLLQEGLKEFGQKVKKWFQWAGQEFLRYIDKVLDTWTNLQNRFRAWTINAEELKKKLHKADGKKVLSISQNNLVAIEAGITIAGQADAIANGLDRLADAADKRMEDDEPAMYKNSTSARDAGTVNGSIPAALRKYIPDPVLKAFNSMQEISQDPNRGNEQSIDTEDVKHWVNFAKDDRAKCIKALQKMRNTFAKLINRGIKSADAESDDVKSIKRCSSAVREMINKFISMINKATNAVISGIGNLMSPNKARDRQNQQNIAYYFD